MKARIGEKIICECGQDCGEVLRTLVERETVSADAFAVEADHLLPDETPGYGCASCHKPVALQIAGGWRIRTGRGWIE